MTVKEIIKQYLEANGFDGLANGYLGCGCKVSDLQPCGEDISMCKPGHLTDCDPDTCSASGDCDWHIEAGKRP